MNEDDILTYKKEMTQMEFLDKTAALEENDTIAVDSNKPIDYFEEYFKEYPAIAIPMYVGDGPAFPTLVENDKIKRKILSKEQSDKISNNIKDLETNIATHQMQQSINDTVEAAKKYYFSNEGVVRIEPTGDNVKVVDSELENIAHQNSEKLQSLKFPNISVDLSKLSLKEVTEYVKQANPIPIKRDSVAEFEKNSLNRRYSVS